MSIDIDSILVNLNDYYHHGARDWSPNDFQLRLVPANGTDVDIHTNGVAARQSGRSCTDTDVLSRRVRPEAQHTRHAIALVLSR